MSRQGVAGGQDRPQGGRLRKRGKGPLRQALFGMGGADPTRIDGISVETTQTIRSEIGPDLARFESEKQFVSCVRFAPRQASSGGKPLHQRNRKLLGCSRVREALRMAAMTVRCSQTALGAYYRSVAVHKAPSSGLRAPGPRPAEASTTNRGQPGIPGQRYRYTSSRLRPQASIITCTW